MVDKAMKRYLCFCISLIAICIQAQEAKKIIIVSTGFKNFGISKILINSQSITSSQLDSFYSKTIIADSVEFKISYSNLLMQKREKSYKYLLSNKNNYFVIKYKGYPAYPFIVLVEGKALEQLKRKRHIVKKIKEFSLE